MMPGDAEGFDLEPKPPQGRAGVGGAPDGKVVIGALKLQNLSGLEPFW